MKPRGRQPDHCDWRPLRVPRGYKEKYDAIEWEPEPPPEQIVLREGYKAIVDGSNNPFRLVKIEEVPLHIGCGGEFDIIPTPIPGASLDLYKCRKCEKQVESDEYWEIEWKQKR